MGFCQYSWVLCGMGAQRAWAGFGRAWQGLEVAYENIMLQVHLQPSQPSQHGFHWSCKEDVLLALHAQEYVLEHLKAAPGGGPGQPAEAPSMPTRTELRAAGRGDLVRAIAAAGGFLAVAQVRVSAVCATCRTPAT